MELKFSDGVSRTFFSLGILNDEACFNNTPFSFGDEAGEDTAVCQK